MNEKISGGDFLVLMKDSFERGLSVIFTPSGTSMLPLLNGVSDTVTLCEKPSQLKKYDVIFYIREDGAFVLHRIVRCEKDGTYTLSGDNQYSLETGVRYESIKAVMTAFRRNGRDRSVKDASYLIYTRCLLAKKMLRIALSKNYLKLFYNE